jgi:maleate cis-trans isomerase
MKRVTAISPYSEAVDAAEHCFFAEGGIETIAGAHLDITDGFRLTEPAPESMFDLRLGAAVKRAHDPLASMLRQRGGELHCSRAASAMTPRFRDERCDRIT